MEGTRMEAGRSGRLPGVLQRHPRWPLVGASSDHSGDGKKCSNLTYNLEIQPKGLSDNSLQLPKLSSLSWATFPKFFWNNFRSQHLVLPSLVLCTFVAPFNAQENAPSTLLNHNWSQWLIQSSVPGHWVHLSCYCACRPQKWLSRQPSPRPVTLKFIPSNGLLEKSPDFISYLYITLYILKTSAPSGDLSVEYDSSPNHTQLVVLQASSIPGSLHASVTLQRTELPAARSCCWGNQDVDVFLQIAKQHPGILWQSSG